MKNPEKVNLILELIKTEYDNDKLDLESLNSIVTLCNNLIVKDVNNLKRQKQYLNIVNNKIASQNINFYYTENFAYPEYSTPFKFDSDLPEKFINEFRNKFQDKYERSSHIYANVAKELFENGNESVLIYLGQIKDEIILCIKKDSEYYQVNDVDEIQKIDADCIKYYDENFGKKLDEYLIDNRPERKRNTRRFEITVNVYNYLTAQNYESIILFPAICMDNDTNNPAKESYKYRYTYMMTFGDKSLDFNKFDGVTIFDRNGLCPPPDNSNC